MTSRPGHGWKIVTMVGLWSVLLSLDCADLLATCLVYWVRTSGLEHGILAVELPFWGLSQPVIFFPLFRGLRDNDRANISYSITDLVLVINFYFVCAM